MASAPHVAVCIPSGEMVHTDFMLSVVHLVQQARVSGIRTSIVNAKYSIVSEARNLAVNAATEARIEWLLFLDSDMVFPADTVERLLKRDVPIVGCTYARRILPITYIGTDLEGRGLNPMKSHGMAEVARLPAGCLLIKSEVFRRMKRPYFRCGYDEQVGTIVGEDFWFCDAVRALGYRVWCDYDLSRQIEHIGAFRYAGNR